MKIIKDLFDVPTRIIPGGYYSQKGYNSHKYHINNTFVKIDEQASINYSNS